MDIDKLLKELRRHEGMRNFPYKCSAGKLTIGVGRNIEDIGITDDEADYLLRNDILRVQDDLDRNVAYWRVFPERTQRALVNFVFNVGITRALRFKRMWAALSKYDFHQAADELLDSKYAKQVGRRAEDLADMIRESENASDFIGRCR